MKKRLSIYFVATVISVFLASVAMSAQPGRRYYVDAGWQFNASVANQFSVGASGWGAYAEGGYYLMPCVAVGGFVSFNTNNDYIPRKTYYYEDGSAVTTDKVNSIFQLPFGAAIRYRLGWKQFQPYAEAKIGTAYAREYVYMSNLSMRDSQWGFYISPEIGFTWHPFYRSNVGLQFAVYYAYSTNKSRAFGLDGINNVGFKLGLSF